MSILSHNSLDFHSTEVQDEPVSAQEAYHNLHDALTSHDSTEALQQLEYLTPEDIVWRLSGENDTIEVLEDQLSEPEITELKNAIIEDAITLAVRRLPADTIQGIGLDAKHYDDAGINQPPTIREALLLAKSWDNTDHNETLGALLATMLDTLPDSIADTSKQAFERALEDNISFHEARNKIFAKIDNRLDRNALLAKDIPASTDKEEPPTGPGMDQYEWLWNRDVLRPDEQKLADRNNRIANLALRRAYNRTISFFLPHQR